MYDLLVTVLMLGNDPGPGSTTTVTRPVAYPAALESGEHPLYVAVEAMAAVYARIRPPRVS